MSLSIIIPAYNEEKYLPTLLSSLDNARRHLHDLWSDYPAEVIVVDNCSTDQTIAVAAAFSATVIRENRRNVASVRNTGAASARGTYLVFIDADYRVESNFMTRIVQEFENNLDTLALGVTVSMEPSELGFFRRGFANALLSLLRKIASMSFGVFGFRGSYFREIGGFDERFYAYEDLELHNKVKGDLYGKTGCYRILDDVRVYASPRGFYRGRMITSYARMFFWPKARTDAKLCGYWYDR